MLRVHLARSFAAGSIGSILLVGMLALNGCAPLLLGAAASGGLVAAYSHGVVVKTYDADYHKTVAASRQTLASLKIPVTDTVADELKTTITAKRPDQTPVTIEVVRLEEGRTQVGIRTGPVGVSEMDTSARIHEQLRKHFALAKPTPLRFPPDAPSVTAPTITGSDAVRDKPAADAQVATPVEFIIYFDQGSNELRESEHPKLDRAVASLTARPKVMVTLNGYADATGRLDYNQIVSESRASTVKMYMVGKGIDPLRIRVIGHGASNFVAPNTGQGSLLNRRVEIAFDGQ